MAAWCTLIPVVTCEQVTSGRWLPSARRGLPIVIGIGVPVWYVISAEACQPPISESTRRFTLEPIGRPRPTGNSATTAATNRLVASLALTDHSLLRLSSSCGLPVSRYPINALKPAEESSSAFAHV